MTQTITIERFKIIQLWQTNYNIYARNATGKTRNKITIAHVIPTSQRIRSIRIKLRGKTIYIETYYGRRLGQYTFQY